MAKIERTKRWSSGMELLNVVVPPHVTHKELVKMSRQLCLMDFKFRPWSPEFQASVGSRTVRDIAEFMSRGVRFIIIEDENMDICSMVIEFLDTDQAGVHFEMRENR